MLTCVLPHTAVILTYLRDQRDDGLPSMATNNRNSYSSWIQALKETWNFPASEAHRQEKQVKTPHFTLCPGYQDTQGRSSRGSCTPETKPRLQSGTLGYSDHFIQSQDITTAGLDKEQHNINTTRAIKSSNLLQLLILCRVSCDTQHRVWLANTHYNSILSSGCMAGLGMPSELRPTRSSLAGHSYEKERSKSLEPHFARNLIFRLL